jgi:D-xylose transport system ATP-binding protein
MFVLIFVSSWLILQLVRQLRDRGLAVVLISHNLTEVFRVADRITVLRLGRRVATFDRKVVTPRDVVEAITGGMDLPEGFA